MKAPNKVLHVLGGLERGGVETWLLNCLTRLDPARWRFDFCALGPEPGRYAPLALERGSRVLHCPLRPSPVAFAARFWRLLRQQRYQLVASHVHHFSAAILGLAGAAGARARVSHAHNTSDGRRDTLPRRLYRGSSLALLGGVMTRGVACSQAAAVSFYGPHWRSRRVEIVPYGVAEADCGADSPAEVRRRLGLDPEAPVIGHVGRFDPQKNHGFLLQVAAELRRLKPQARWLLVGDGAGRGAIERQIRDLDLGGTVVLAGRREDAPRLMGRAMDLLLFPSLFEGLPLALVEAQAAGLPALASSRITREAAVVKGAVEFLPLEAGPRVWAERACRRLADGRLPPDRCATAIQAAGLTIEQSLDRLLQAYARALGEGIG